MTEMIVFAGGFTLPLLGGCLLFFGRNSKEKTIGMFTLIIGVFMAAYVIRFIMNISFSH
jgi:type IV secretory pathway VirB2 component (pilin)